MRKWTSLLLILSLFAIAHATILLNETFDTDTNWLSLSNGADSVYDGKMHMSGANDSALGWLVNGRISLKNFTISVETQMSNTNPNAHIGITFRTQDNSDAYQFYIYPSGHYFIAKYVNNTYTDFSNKRLQANTFISGSANTLKVVGLDNTFYFLCNGQLLTTITDDALPNAGMFGLIITGQISATFDNLVINDEAVPDNGLKVFQDNFSAATLNGWANYAGLGAFTLSGEKLHCAADNASVFSTLVSNGDYGVADTISVVTEKVSSLPGTQNLFGLFFHYSTVSIRDTLRTRGYIFCIMNGSHYALLRLSDAQGSNTSYTLINPTLSLGVQNAAVNTLKVVNSPDGKKDLYINNNNVASFTDNTFPSGGVGLAGLGGVTVNFDDFRVAAAVEEPLVEREANFLSPAVPTLKAIPNPFNANTRIQVNGISGAPFKLCLYDAQGHRIGKWEARKPSVFTWDAGTLPPGIYFARLICGKNTVTERLVLLR